MNDFTHDELVLINEALESRIEHEPAPLHEQGLRVLLQKVKTMQATPERLNYTLHFKIEGKRAQRVPVAGVREAQEYYDAIPRPFVLIGCVTVKDRSRNVVAFW